MNKTLLMLLLLLVGTQLLAQDVAEKANQFIQLLTPDLRGQALYPMDDEERFNWNFVPVPRKGPTFRDFTLEQQEAALNLLKASVSAIGFEKTGGIVSLEKVLLEIENDRLKMPDGSSMRDPENYHIAVFGTPSSTGDWGWRFEGHHVSWNFALSDGEIISSTPSFLGVNPGVVKSGKRRGLEVLHAETALGFQLINALSPQQLKIAKFSDQPPKEIITGSSQKVGEIEKKGIAYPDLTEDQRKLFIDLLNEYVNNYQFGFAKRLHDKIVKSGIDNLFFAWAGSMEPGAGHYYRIQGPMLLIEYDNVQNDANHVHTAVRDLTNDFAEDILRDHYKNHH